MKLEQLVYAVEIANTQSISKAAENLLLSQPGLSTSIKQLEYELGAELFIRTGKGVELTETGSNFISSAKKILAQLEDLERQCKPDQSEIYRTLSIASGPYRFIGALTALLLNAHTDDGTRYTLRTGSVNDCIDWVADGVCDIGVVNFYADEEQKFQKLMKRKQLQYQTIYATEAKVIIGAGHPLYHTDATSITAEELQKYPMVIRDQTSAGEYYKAVFLQQSQENLRVILTDQAAVYEMLEFSDGYCLGHASEYMYKNLPRQYRTKELKVIGQQAPRSIAMAWIAPANVEYLPLAKEFLQAVTDVCTKPDFWELHPEFKNLV